MATSTITITPVTNIKNMAVVNNNKVETEFYDSYMDVFTRVKEIKKALAYQIQLLISMTNKNK